MNDLLSQLRQAVPLQPLLGYLNFSSGKAEPRFLKGWNAAWATLVEHQVAEPWRVLPELLAAEAEQLEKEGGEAFRDSGQARAVLRLLVQELLPAYRRHHEDLLRHQSEAALFQCFFVAKAIEGILAQGGPWEETDRIVAGAVYYLNDYVGYRPVAVLENRTKGELYPHERHRPVPLYLKGVGVASGPYQPLFEQTLEILRGTSGFLLEEASLDLEQLAEWAVDLRAYDHLHPVNRRPNYIFGEWDPHTLDNSGNHLRMVSRQVILDALMERLPPRDDPNYADKLFEGGAVLAGTVLMAASIGGRAPTSFQSNVSLATLVPRIARLRDEFYKQLLAKQEGQRGERWREESAKHRQPFGHVRQSLNTFMANARARQLQQRRLALFFAELGYLPQARELAEQLATPSARFTTELEGLLAAAYHEIERGELDLAATRLPECENLLRRGIDCGALVDPWNILGFQAQFPLFQTTEDSVHDGRVDELLRIMEQLFTVQARLYSEAAATGQTELLHTLPHRIRRVADWWDTYASFEVAGVPRIRGGEHIDSAEQVAKALDLWHRRGEVPADLVFWKKQLKRFSDPKCYGMVLETLLRKRDYQAAMGLLISWLSQADDLPLEDGAYSFPSLAMRWLVAVLEAARAKPPVWDAWPLVERFFSLLEANAEEYWEVPMLGESLVTPVVAKEDNPFAAAYEDMTFHDSADDGSEGAVAEGGGPVFGEFALDDEDDYLGERLRFLASIARLWKVVGRQVYLLPGGEEPRTVVANWLAQAESRLERLTQLMDDVQRYPIPEPSGSYDSLVEFDRRRVAKERLLEGILAASRDFVLACRSLRSVLASKQRLASLAKEDDWESTALQLEVALNRSDAERTRQLLPLFADQFADEPLLYSPLDSGGEPRKILAARTAQDTLRDLVERLPRLGLLRHTFMLLKQARDMEQRRPLPGRQITEFNHLFQNAFQEVVTTLVESAGTWDLPQAESPLVKTLETLLRPFIMLWMEHSQTVRLSSLESLQSEAAWKGLQQFIRLYGKEVFTAKFMILANLRGILGKGTEAYLDYLENDPEAEPPEKLMADLREGKLTREAAINHLSLALKAIVENYEEFKDYNSTTTQSDYGDNLYRLIAFLRLKSNYDRHAWNFRPYVWAHEVLCRKGRFEAAALTRRDFARLVSEIAKAHLEELKKLQALHGMPLRTVADYLAEAFARPMEYDELVALVEPAFEAARRGQGPEAFEQLRRKLAPFAEETSGIGLEAPNWLRRLEGELERLLELRSGLVVQVEGLLNAPRIALKLPDIQKQLANWDQPLNAEPGE